MSHRNAPLTELGRLRLARCVVDDGWPLRRAAERFQVSATTAKRWADRYRAVGHAGMSDRSSRPHHSPNRTPTRTERRIIKIRLQRRWGPARIAYLLGLPPSTVHRVLARYRMARLRWLDRATAAPVRRYEHDAPGDLIHVDIKKLGNIPDGGGHRALGRRAGARNRTSTPGKVLRRNGASHVGCSYLHNAVDDHSRLAYSEILPDERRETAVTFWQRARKYFATRGITIKRVSPTTDPATGRSSGDPNWQPLASLTNGPGLTDRRPTARSNGSTAPCSRNGPTPALTCLRPTAVPRSPTGCTPTIITAATRTRRTPTSQPRSQPLRSVHLVHGQSVRFGYVGPSALSN